MYSRLLQRDDFVRKAEGTSPPAVAGVAAGSMTGNVRFDLMHIMPFVRNRGCSAPGDNRSLAVLLRANRNVRWTELAFL
jgi:hypothetical protein